MHLAADNNSKSTTGNPPHAGKPVVKQKTIRNAIHCQGVGLHGGVKCRMDLHPAEPGHGIAFRRSDIADGDALIPARWDNVCDTRLCTTIANAVGVRVSTVEHLMAALSGCEIDNILIEVDGPEVPIMDGSSEPFVKLIKCAGIVEQAAPRRALRILREISVVDGNHRISISPSAELSVAFKIEFDSAAISATDLDVDLVNGTFNDTISSARTFGFLADIDRLRQAGLAKGGSLENAVVVDGDRVVNPEGLRFDDEFVRHKILDCVGDLYLAGGPIFGRVIAERSGHGYNNQLLHALFAAPDSWEWVDLDGTTDMSWTAEDALALA